MEQQRNYTVKQFRPNENCWQSDTAHSYYAAAPVGSPPPKPTGGFTAFPANAPQIFPLQQSLVTLAFNATKLQPQNSRVWKRLRRIFVMLARERKETKEALWKFLRLNEIDKEVVIQPKVQRLRENLVEKEKTRRKFTEKPPPDLSCVAWLLGVVPVFLRAPNPCLRVAG
jgi:hypothetical protein